MMEADDGYEPRPDDVVTVGRVNVVLSQLVISELAAAGIRAQAVEQRGRANTNIVCFARDRDAAARIIDRIFETDGAPPARGLPSSN